MHELSQSRRDSSVGRFVNSALTAVLVLRGDSFRAGPHLAPGCRKAQLVTANQLHALESMERNLVRPMEEAGYETSVTGLVYNCSLNGEIERFWRASGRDYSVAYVARGARTQRTLLRLALAAAARIPAALYCVARLDITFGAPVVPGDDWSDAVAVPWLPRDPMSGKAPDQIYYVGHSRVDAVLSVLARFDSNVSEACSESAQTVSPRGGPNFHGACDCTQRLFLGPLARDGVRLRAIYPDAPTAGSCDRRRGRPGPFADCGRCAAAYCLRNSTAACRAYARSLRARCPAP